MWPRNIALTNNSTTEQNDDVTQILMGGASVFSLGGNTFDSKDNQSNQWRDMIEEKKLNPASRRQTCHLVTIYFTQKILTQQKIEEKKVVDFIDQYGAYLELYSSLVVAGNLRLKEVVARLMDVAKHDPIHNDAVNALSIKGTPVLYEPVRNSNFDL